MKKVIVVSKTHLDMGFTDFAENIRQKYISRFIPEAIELAEAVNKNGKRFIWTTGSWIIKEALLYSTEENRAKLLGALKNGDISVHGLPFTLHSELLNAETLEYGLKIKERIEEITGKKITAAKMTDVPGHTKGIVPLLAKHGIKLLHIGVNGVSAVPEVPPCFLWKCGDAEVVVIYSGDYGGAFKTELTEEVLYLDHTVDNRGAPTPEKFEQRFSNIEHEFPGYEICAGTLDDYAEIIWQKRGELPIVTDEIGDTWIHGAAADPYKAAALRELCDIQEEMLLDGTLVRDSDEYNDFCDALLCIAEHTCGLDSKMYFADYEHYLKHDFTAARRADIVEMINPLADYPQNLFVKKNRELGIYKTGSYSTMEKSWAEQRAYIDKALSALDEKSRLLAEERLTALLPENETRTVGYSSLKSAVTVGENTLKINMYGGIEELILNGTGVIKQNIRPVLEYRSYGKKDYDYWLRHYSRNMSENEEWGYGDFARPVICNVDGKFKTGRFYYTPAFTGVKTENGNAQILIKFICNEKLCDELGAPRTVEILYTLTQSGLKFRVSWFEKDANRLTEAIFLHIYPEDGEILFGKLGTDIDYKSVVSMGGRNLHAARYATLAVNGKRFKIANRHAPLLSPGKGKILEYNNKIEDISQDGLSYVLYNNVWGTNFPLWYEENAAFEFEISELD